MVVERELVPIEQADDRFDTELAGGAAPAFDNFERDPMFGTRAVAGTRTLRQGALDDPIRHPGIVFAWGALDESFGVTAARGIGEG